MSIRCAYARKVGVLRATCGMPRPERRKRHTQKNNTQFHLPIILFYTKFYSALGYIL
ncbi:MAG: hypothetical protein NZ519_11735 [Bacteroidia bacterium]|nr:hypothetical protein [Bacteroidia bacterium]